MPNKPRSEISKASDTPVTPAVPRQATRPVDAGETQDAVAARVNRRQAAAAAQVRERQAAAVAEAQKRAQQHPAQALRQATGPIAQVVTFPYVLGREVAEDIVSTARRPDAVLYWGGLAGLAALGVLEWPAAVALGVGVAVASGIRRARA